MLLYTKESRVLVYLDSKSYFRFTLISIVYGFKGPWHYLSDFKEVFFPLHTTNSPTILLKTWIQESIRKFYGLVPRISYDSKIISIYETVKKLVA